ncbi:RpiR family transcriptional regulator [Alkalihalobacillus alcalophilus ATCC 27647 = CGMCC 1.3604]|uniref:RpiR family transcriptional regulator n=1 Tax=Alkalihalobacillus alcalophilus ATCC 27647 = CGMCC 1.3604 TaxID=1218173 RepID=A0A4S4JTF9_ALKAL|nr:MurR/RpiR family transcriptional regulator [Alkalihalobacillus alcalophilus]MED1560634.1 MurR/RpiR family transcriptional regulator [Alkalihalobacillus alcalophilus]THG88361.1 RpiR family transcriptional regulator [Alkalihalobacillus alcalophilus ATCC 27647 = CGMCC 1.3604]
MSFMTGGLVMLTEMLPKLPPSEKKIAEYLIEHPQESISLTAHELGKRSATSSAAVIRLCKSLNLKGLPDLKLRIAGDLQKKIEHGLRDIEPNESAITIIDKMTSNSIQTIRETAELLNIEELEKAIEKLNKARRIHFFGIGASGIIAHDAQQKFLRIDKTTYAFTDVHMATTLVATATDEDVAIGISFSGETREVSQFLEVAKNKGLSTISLTKYGQSLVSETADIQLYTSATKEPTFRSGATSSRIAQLQVIDILFMCVASSQYDKSVKHLNETRNVVETLRFPSKGRTKVK